MRFVLLACALLMSWSLTTLKAEDLPPVVFIPFDKVPTVDPGKQAVFVPYEKFMQLWENSKKPPEEQVKPPIGATLNDYTLIGSVRGDLAEFTLKGTITGLGKEWATVTLPAKLGISGFTPDDDGLVIERTDNALIIHVRGTGKHSFTATVAAPVTGDAAGRRSVSLPLPAAGAGRLELQVPQADAELNIKPAVAATTTPGDNVTTLLAVLGGTNQVQIDWQPPAEVATGESMLLSDGRTRLTISERSLLYELGLNLTVLRRPLNTVSLTIPADTQVLKVEGKDVRTWERVVAADGTATLSVSFHQPIIGNYELFVHMERSLEALAPGASGTVSVAWPAVVNAARATGYLAIVQGEGLVVAVDAAEGVSQVDPKETRTVGAAVAAYRYYAAPPAFNMLITRLASDLRAGVHQLVRLGREEDIIAVVLDLDVRKAGIFAVALDVPATWELIDTSGLQLDDARLAEPVGDFRRLDLALRGRLFGNGQIIVRFKAPPSIPREAQAGKTTVTVARLLDARQIRGTLAVATPSSWSLTSNTRNGLTGTEVEVLRRSGPLALLAKEIKDDEDLPLGFTFIGTEASTELSIAPRARELNIRHEELISVAEGHLRRLATLRGEVRYSALPALRLSAPSSLDGKLIFKGTTLAEQKILSSKDGRSIWELRFQAPVSGSFTITVEDHRDVPALTAGTPLQFALEPLTILDATRVNHVCAVAREGTVEVKAAADGLETMAPADLPAGLHTQGVVAGFQGSASVPLALTLVRHDLVTLADGSVTAARYVAVISEERLLRVQGELLLNTRGRPYLEVRLPEGAQLLEVAVDARQSRPSRRADGSVVIPLGDGAGLRSQIVAFVYEQTLGESSLGTWGSLNLSLPQLGTTSGVTPEAGKDNSQHPLPVGPVEVDLYLPSHLHTCGWRGDVLPTLSIEPLWGNLLTNLGGVAIDQSNAQVHVNNQGLTVPVTLNGKRHHLQRLGDGGSVQFGFIANGFLQILALLACVGGGLVMWWSRRRNDVLAGIIITAAVLVAAISEPWFIVVAGFAAGVAVLFIVLLLQACVLFIKQRKKTPSDITPDPWLEQAQPLPAGAALPAAESAPATPAAEPAPATPASEPTKERPSSEQAPAADQPEPKKPEDPQS